MSGAGNRNGRRNDSGYHSVVTGFGIGNENGGVAAGDDHYLPSHCHDVNAVGGKDGCHPGRPNKWAPWVSVAQRPRNGVSEKMLVKKGFHLTIDMRIVGVRCAR